MEGGDAPAVAELEETVRTIVTDEVRVAAGSIGTADDLGSLDVYDEERTMVSGAVERRRVEFLTGRALARRAAATLGVALPPLPAGVDRGPSWPEGLVGSLTHSGSLCAVAVALSGNVSAIGLDLERAVPLDREVADLVSSQAERAASRVDDSVPTETLIFSCKEALYKAWAPRARRWLGFDDVVVGAHPDGTFHAEFRREGDEEVLGPFLGRFATCCGFVVASVVVPTGRSADLTDRAAPSSASTRGSPPCLL